jgi:hypothetical protein
MDSCRGDRWKCRTILLPPRGQSGRLSAPEGKRLPPRPRTHIHTVPLFPGGGGGRRADPTGAPIAVRELEDALQRDQFVVAGERRVLLP